MRIEIIAGFYVYLARGQNQLLIAFLKEQVKHRYKYMISLEIQKLTVKFDNMNMNELTTGERINLPKSVIRQVSLEKLRSKGLSQNQNITNNMVDKKDSLIKKKNQICQRKSPHKKLYQKLLDKKLGLAVDKQNKSGWYPGQKVEKIKQQLEQKEKKQCTFKPQINSSEKQKRTINTFFKDQLTFNQRKNSKIQQMRLLIETNRCKQNTFQPNNQNKKNPLVEGSQSNKVYQRLYEDSKNKDKKRLQKQQNFEIARSQSITKSKRFKGLSRGASAQKKNLLESQTESKDMKSQIVSHKISINQPYNHSQQISSIMTRKNSVQLSKAYCEVKNCKQTSKRIDLNIYEKKDTSKNQEIYINKLMKQMIKIIEKCSLPLIFSYLQMNQFFLKMNFIPNQGSSNSRSLLHEIWDTLQGEQLGQVSSISIMKIVYAIMGRHNVTAVNKCIYQHWFSDSQKLSQIDKNLSFLGKKMSFRQNVLMLTEKDSKNIRNTYEQFYLCRLKSGQSQLLHDQIQAEHTFRPMISKTSNEYAEKYRNRMLQESQKLVIQNKLQFAIPKDRQLNHVSLLMLDQKRKDALIQQKRKEREIEIKRQEDASMLSEERSNLNSARSRTTDRNQQLYQMGKNFNKQRTDRLSDEIQQQKWKMQLTFKPNLNKKSPQPPSKQLYIPDYEKTIFRMQQGRRRKESSISRQNQQKNISPILYLNVVMQGIQPVKIPVFNDDNIKTITNKVKVMMNLDRQSDSTKLQKILKMQIMPALKQLGMANLINQ